MRFLIRSLILLALAVGMSDIAQAAQVEIQTEGRVSGDWIRLGDIARIQDANPEIVQKLQSLVIAPSPTLEKPIWIPYADIRSRMEVQGVNLGTIRFQGANIVKVQRSEGANLPSPVASPAPEDWIRQQIQGFLSARAPHLGQVTLTLQIDPQSITRLKGQAPILQTITGWKHPLDGPQQLTLHLTDRNGQAFAIGIDCSLHQVPWLPVPKHHLPAGHTIQSSDLMWIQLSSQERMLTQWQDIVGKVTRRELPAHEPLSEIDLRTVPLIRSNEIVIVSVRGHGFSIRREMKSRSSAALGEQVLLIDPETKETLSARVTGPRTAEVGPPPVAQPPRNFQFVSPAQYQSEQGKP